MRRIIGLLSENYRVLNNLLGAIGAYHTRAVMISLFRA
jgi:hypothetical protein